MSNVSRDIASDEVWQDAFKLIDADMETVSSIDTKSMTLR